MTMRALIRTGQSILFAAIALTTIQGVPVEAAVVRDLRIGDQKGYVRFVVESDRAISPTPLVNHQENRLHISLEGVINTIPRPKPDAFTADIQDLDIVRQSDAPAINVVFAFLPARVQTFALTGPHRFIIDVFRPPTVAGDSIQFSIEPDVRDAPSFAMESHSAPSEKADPGMSPRQNPPSEAMRGSDAGVVQRSIQPTIITTLILITSIAAILLAVLIGVSVRRNRHQSSLHDRLPPEHDPAIDDLDKQIRELLDTRDPLRP